MAPTFPNAIYDYIDANKTKFVTRLRDAVGYASVSQDTTPEGRKKVFAMADYLEGQLKTLTGIKTEQVKLGKQTGTDVDLPNLVVGTLGTDPNKKTVLIYGHFDVQPASKADGWDQDDPFALNELPDGRMVGRGSTDDKGPVLGWINALEAYQQSNVEIPVNLKFCFEGMEEQGSEGLNEYIKNQAQDYFKGVDYVTICDNYWLNTTIPIVTYGLRGIAMFGITIEGAPMNLHSGIYGGMIFEPMTDLITILSRLVDNQAKILVPGVENLVPDPTSDEIELYEQIDYSVQDLNDATQADVGLSSDKVTLLMGRMRFPTLTIHSVDNGTASQPGSENVAPSTIIPHKVTGKISCRLVPDQTPDVVGLLVKNYVLDEFKKLHSKNKLTFINYSESARPWLANPKNESYQAAARATNAVYRKDPNFTREGGSIGVAITLADAFGNDNVLLLPMGRGDDNPHAPNEKLDKDNYFGGTKVMATYLWELAHGGGQ